MIRRLLPALAVLATAAACGDGAPSKEAYLEKADPLCRLATSEATAMTTPTDMNGLRQFHIKLAEGVDRTVAKLEKLKVPGGDDGRAAKAVVQALRDAAGAARAVAPAVDASDYGGTETTARQAADAFRAADGQARSLGSRECGRGEADAVGRMVTALPTTVKKAFISAADAMCKAAWLEYDKLEPPESLAEVKAFFEKAIPIEEKLVRDLRAIKPPVTDRDKVDAVLVAYETIIAKEKEALAAAAAGKERELDSLWETADRLAFDAESKADGYGFVDCGSQAS